MQGTEIELEITALVAPAHAAAITRVCRRLRTYLAERFPGILFRVELSNLWLPFPTKLGSAELDEDVLYEACVEDLKVAIRPDGTPLEFWDNETRRRPVDRVTMSGFNECLQTGYWLPGGTDVAQTERKVLGKVELGQHSGSRPWMLATILDYWPEGGLLDRPYENISEKAFRQSEGLCGLAEIPCSASRVCRVIWPANPSGLGELWRGVRQILDEAFAFTYEHSLYEP